MKLTLHLQLGENSLMIEEEVTSIQDVFKFYSQFADIPAEGPNGEKDLALSYRKAQGKYEYFSVVCPSAKSEFMFGQTTDSHDLFPKSWVPIQLKRYLENGESVNDHQVPPHHPPATQQAQSASAAAFAAQAPALQTQPQQAQASPPAANYPSPADLPDTNPREKLLTQIGTLVKNRLVFEKDGNTRLDFANGLLGVPVNQASIGLLNQAVANLEHALKCAVIVEWGGLEWRCSTHLKSECLGLMVSVLGTHGQEQLLKAIGAPPPPFKSIDQAKKMRDNLASWLERQPE